MSRSGDIDVTSKEGSGIFEYLILRHFPVKFYFLNNDKSYNRDFFTIDTIDDGLSFHGIESVLSSNNLGLVLYTISRKDIHVYRATWLNRRARTARD